MRTKAEVLKEHYGVETGYEALEIRHTAKFPIIPLDQWTTLKVPYKAPGCPEIPSIEEIDKELRTNPLSPPLNGRACKIGDYIIKRNTDTVILQEAENLLFLEKYEVRSPKLYAVLEKSESSHKVFYMVSEYIEGQTLPSNLDTRLKEKLCQRLAEQFKLLQSIPSEGYYGRIHRQGFHPSSDCLRTRYQEMCGPYNSFDEILSAMFRTAELSKAELGNKTLKDYSPEEMEFLSQFKPILGSTKGRTPVLTVLNSSWNNIIVRSIKNDRQEIEDWEVTLVDWDSLGWLPVFMQHGVLQERMAYHDMIFAHLPGQFEAELKFLKEANKNPMVAYYLSDFFW